MINQNLLLTGDDGYNLTKSLRFRASVSGYLNRTYGTPTNNKVWTWSAWVKRGSLSLADANHLFMGSAYDVGSNPLSYARLVFETDNTLRLQSNNSAGEAFTSNAVYRDTSAWYHIVLSMNASSTVVNCYVNGVEISYASKTNPTNTNTEMNKSGNYHRMGFFRSAELRPFDGYMAEVNFIDGQALTPSSFGSTNPATGVWQPAKYTGTYGTNGFYLPFTNTASTSTLGNDFSGNGNTWTVNNISLTAGSTYDSMTDVPTLTSATTANYCVMNPLDATGGSITNGNLTVTTTGSNINCRASFVIPTTGKWYFETTDVVTGGNNIVGIANSTLAISASQTGATGSIYTGMFSNAVYGFAFNFDALTYTIYKNNSVDASGSITSGIAYSIFIATSASGGASTAFNFGQQPFTYTPPTGFVALNTYNLPTSTIVKGNTVMDVNTWTGTGATNVITNSGAMKPDFVWIKGRSNATYHMLTNSVTGSTKYLYSNDTLAEGTWTDQLTSFNSNGFTLGADTNGTTNFSGRTYVGWQWQAGQGTNTSNTSGSITSTVSVNASAGFSIVTYTGNGSGGATIGHGLGVAPKMYIVKRRDSGAGSTNWYVYNVNLNNGTNPAQYYLQLQSTSGQGGASNIWNDTAPTSSVFSVGTSSETNGSGGTFVAYCWTPIAGYSAFGSYTGNGSSDGAFVYTGFRPAFIMIKRTDAGGTDWVTMDYQRLSYNVTDVALNPNASYAENSGYATDFVSNGFKLRTTTSFLNGSGATYIYMAFAENPFKNALAR